jgi:uncharacterized protein YjiS (DUF1127 family)
MNAMTPHRNSPEIKSGAFKEDNLVHLMTWAKATIIRRWTAYQAYRARHAAKSHLLLLDPHLLRDIGIRRDQIDLVLESGTQPGLGSQLAAPPFDD